MQAHARFALGLVALLAALLAVPSMAVAAPTPVSPSLLRSASWHGRAIQKPISTTRTAAVPRLDAGPRLVVGPRPARPRVRAGRRLGARPGGAAAARADRLSAGARGRALRCPHPGRGDRLPAQARPAPGRRCGESHAPEPSRASAAALATRVDGGRTDPRLGLQARGGGSVRVRRLQRQLARLGYDSGEVDGLYGPRTQRAVTGFERSRGLPANGVAGLDTLRALALIAGAPRHLTPNQTSRPRPAAPAGPRAVQAHRTRRVPVLPLIAGLALLGLLTLWTSYLRALARIRRARAEVPWIDQARLGSGNGDGLGGVDEKKNARVRRLARAQGGTMTTDLTTIGSHLRTDAIIGRRAGNTAARRLGGDCASS